MNLPRTASSVTVTGMRALLWFIAAITVSLLVATALAYPAYQLIHPLHAAWRFDKIASRLFDLVLLGCIIWVLRHLGLRGAAAWGWKVAAPTGRRQFAIGLGLGLCTMLPVSIAMIYLGVRPLDPGLDALMLRSALVAGIGSGLVVGLVEETLFRGLIQGAVTAHVGTHRVGILAVAALFAALHFLGNVQIPDAAVTPSSGWELLTGTLAAFAHPLTIIDAFLALFGVGLLTGIAREWTGNVAFPAGLHAGWVCVMRTTIGVTQLPQTAAHAGLLSSHDGYTGWLVASFVCVFMVLGGALQRPLRAFLRAP
ncbi:MAG: CPBP family intramembrane glutamic endopeptidase [Pseudomonadota bacterium]|jgi:hypothetical protein